MSSRFASTWVDHVTAVNAALVQLPVQSGSSELRARPTRRAKVKVLVRTDAASATQEYAAHPHQLGVRVLGSGHRWGNRTAVRNIEAN
jgi:hypothetical protein